MTNIIFQFPGQGSQKIAMLHDYAKASPIIKQTFALASEICDKDIWAITQEGPEALLNDTTVTQPAMLAADVAIYRLWLERGGRAPTLVAGHSLGEYAALVAAEALSYEGAIKLVQKRAHYMATAQAPGVGAVGVIIGFDYETVASWCQNMATATQQVSVANINSPSQLVIAGHRAAVENLLAHAQQQKARIARMIPVSVPVHCTLMQDAADQLKEDLDKAVIAQPSVPVIFNVDAQQHKASQDIRDALYKQLFSPVQWCKIMQVMQDAQANALVESGPGGVLSGLYKRTYRKADSAIINLNSYDTFEKELIHEHRTEN